MLGSQAASSLHNLIHSAIPKNVRFDADVRHVAKLDVNEHASYGNCGFTAERQSKHEAEEFNLNQTFIGQSKPQGKRV